MATCEFWRLVHKKPQAADLRNWLDADDYQLLQNRIKPTGLSMTTNRELLEIRKSIDNLDNALVAILAERFRLTERVGFIKLENDLPSQDGERERAQQLHYSELAWRFQDPSATLG